MIKQGVPDNPALFVKGPKFSRRVGITPIMEAKQMRQLLDSIPATRKVKVLREHDGGIHRLWISRVCAIGRLLVSLAYTFVRVSAVVALRQGDYRLESKRARLRLMEKGNKENLVWLHREAEEHLAAYLVAAHIESDSAPIFQSLDKAHKLSGNAMTRRDMLPVVKERCLDARLSREFCNHTFLGTGITVFLHNGSPSKQHGIWQTTRTLARPSSMTGGRSWRH